MKVFAYICSVLLLSLPLLRAEAIGDCPAENEEYVVLLPDSEDCTIFYKCDWGTPVVQECPPGFLFNPTESVCDWPENVNC